MAMAGQVAAAHSPSRSSPGVDVDDDVDFVTIKNQPETENLVALVAEAEISTVVSS